MIKEKVMMVLWGFGPASVAGIANIAQLGREQVYAALSRLRGENLVVRKGRATYDVTRRGRRLAAEQQRFRF